MVSPPESGPPMGPELRSRPGRPPSIDPRAESSSSSESESAATALPVQAHHRHRVCQHHRYQERSALGKCAAANTAAKAGAILHPL